MRLLTLFTRVGECSSTSFSCTGENRLLSNAARQLRRWQAWEASRAWAEASRQQTAARRQRVVERTDCTTEAGAVCRVDRAQVTTALAVSGAQRLLGGRHDGCTGAERRRHAAGRGARTSCTVADLVHATAAAPLCGWFSEAGEPAAVMGGRIVAIARRRPRWVGGLSNLPTGGRCG
jgi:hypothetical protein